MIGRQLLRAGTSVGANVEEARGSSSRREYSRKIKIARSEAREAVYWLRLGAAGGLLPEARLRSLIQEADELVRILTTIGKRTETMQTEDRRTRSEDRNER